MRICAIIPCYNTSRDCVPVIRGAQKYCHEVLAVDDGSEDDTKFQAQKEASVVISHKQNRGKGAALLTGFNWAIKKMNAEHIIILDGDGQHDPEHIPEFIKKAAQSSAGIIVGRRLQDTRTMPYIRRFSNRFSTKMISWVCGQPILDSQSGYRLLKRTVLEKIEWPKEGRYETETEILIRAARAGFKIDFIPIKTIYHQKGRKIKSHFQSGRDTWRIAKVVIANLFK